MHVRTTTSGGKLSPAAALGLAKEKGLAAIAIVEHDTMEALPEAVGLSKMMNVEAIPGVELIYEEEAREAHIIGYFVDWHNSRLLSEVARTQTIRINRAAEMLEKLDGLGLHIVYEDLLREAGSSSIISRSHIARHMFRMRMVKTQNEAFEKYLGRGKPAYVPAEQVPIYVVLGFVQDAGGVTALAHPKFGQAEKMIPQLVEEGLNALEVYHPTHTKHDVEHFGRVADKYGLVKVGGTDSGAGCVGEVTVPYSVVGKLKKLIK